MSDSVNSVNKYYDNLNRLTAVTNAYGAVWQGVYDVGDRVTQTTDANSVTVNNTFDGLNRLTARVWAADGIGEKFVYATNGLVYYTNRDTQATQYGRDVAMRKTSETNALLQVTRFAYDAADDVTNLVDGLTHQTAWTYTQYGWLTNKLDNNGNPIILYTCDADGRLTNRWMVGTNNTGYAYDSLGNLTNVTYSNAQPMTISYAYDALNRLTSMIDPVGTTTRTYTPAGRLLTETETAWANNTVSNSYSQGHRTGLNLTQPSGSWSQTYTYDSAWRLHTVVSTPGTLTYGYGSSASALVQSIALPNSALITNSYDSLARLQFTELMNQWGHVLDGYSYAYDHLGLRTGITRNFGLGYNNVAAGYDAIGQLTSWTASEVSGAARLNEQLAYAYDAAGNLHLRTNGGLVETFTVGVSNQIQNISRSGALTVSGATPAPATNITVNGTAAQTYGDFTFASTNNTLANGSNTFTVIAQDIHGASATNTIAVNLPTPVNFQYDGNGNLVFDGTRSFAYDVENQLTNVVATNAWRVDFIYDGLGRRRITRQYSWGGSTWTRTNEIHYIWDDNVMIQERDSNNVVQVTYTRGLDLSGTIQGAGGIGGLLARTDANGSTFYHADGNGNVTALMDAYENIVARYLYDAFGRILAQWGSMANANVMQFSSMPHDGPSGLTAYKFRYYDAILQRWLNRDPLGESGEINLYGFLANSSINYFDPTGLGPLPPNYVPTQKPPPIGGNDPTTNPYNPGGGNLPAQGAGGLISLLNPDPDDPAGPSITALTIIACKAKGLLKPLPPPTPPFVIHITSYPPRPIVAPPPVVYPPPSTLPTAPPTGGCSLCPVNNPTITLRPK